MRKKGKGSVRAEQITCRVLLIVSISAFLLSLIIEFAADIFLNAELYQLLHLEYIKNVMLGLCGSAIISLVSIVFPYLNKAEKTTQKLKSILREIYDLISRIYIFVRKNSSENNIDKKERNDSFNDEINLLKDSDALLNKLKEFEAEYNDSDFTFDEINDIINNFFESIKLYADIVNGAMREVLPSKYYNATIIETYYSKRDISVIRAQEEIYNIILEEIKEEIDLEKFRQKLLSLKINVSEPYFNELRNSLEYILNISSYKETMRKDIINSGKVLEISHSINKIKSRYSSQYHRECEKRKQEFVFALENAKDKDNPAYKTIEEKFCKALLEDRMDEADSLIQELKEKNAST